MRFLAVLVLISAIHPSLSRADVIRAASIRVAPIYVSPDASSAKLADVDRSFLVPAQPTNLPHVLSAFPLLEIEKYRY